MKTIHLSYVLHLLKILKNTGPKRKANATAELWEQNAYFIIVIKIQPSFPKLCSNSDLHARRETMPVIVSWNVNNTHSSRPPPGTPFIIADVGFGKGEFYEKLGLVCSACVIFANFLTSSQSAVRVM